MTRVGDLLAAMRAQHGWTQQQLADRMSLSRPQVANVEAGNSDTSAEAVLNLLDQHGWPTPCPFCAIVAGDAPAEVVAEWGNAVGIVPLNPVTPGHVLIIPRAHVTDVADDPNVTAGTMRCAALWVREHCADANVITSRGPAATQTVAHLHVHVVPRTADDGLHLPWTNQHERHP